jgi:DNA-binding NarL/FixJ family response regulator
MDRNSLEEIERLADLPVRVIVVTSSEVPEEGVAAIRAGARGLVFKRLAVDTLMEALHAVMQGDVWMPPNVQAMMAKNLRGAPKIVLTPREREITGHVANGLRNSEVASKLFISEQTVKTHLNHIFEKLDVRDRVELTLYAIRTGIIGALERKR